MNRHQQLFENGSLVMGKWPSSKLYYKARILHYDGKLYTCQFLDGTIVALKPEYVDSPEKFRRSSQTQQYNDLANRRDLETLFVNPLQQPRNDHATRTTSANVEHELPLPTKNGTIPSLLASSFWILIYVYIQYWLFHTENINIDLMSRWPFVQKPLSNHIIIRIYRPIVIFRYLCIWFLFQFLLARFLPFVGQKLFYTRTDQTYYYKSNSLWAFIVTLGIIYIVRDRLPLKELVCSQFLFSLFSLGFAFVLAIGFHICSIYQKQRPRITNIHANISETNAISVSSTTYYDSSLFFSMHVQSIVILSSERCLITYGLWSMCRHPYLLAEILMVTSWTIPAGFRHWLPWLYPVYITVMAVYKANGYDRLLKVKHPQTWLKYEKQVKHTIVPYIY
ncbi:unnamed protein product [Didymodactylos carnosus]|uniref:Lamin-B receptor of TUDOR domain-containing protein n=1 Tax=Didymodactylos carnosus TaxID=1234261 RepID=A0A813T8W0_9BILA|nr:unnamed protein product [Didymodactylos carnosus]CAF0805936.1 unnamed protein product [Didymodactylos carnosus]CAF3495756.1 unnamed protein product [Didymodactylos carnosus]CAF3591339.1 unnamed protein product [Didymodactylos carnosus]